MITYNKQLFPFKNRWIDIDGNKIHYIDEGSGQIILFSHPPLGSSFMYRNFVKILSVKYRCIALDYPEFGLSVSNTNYKVGLESQSNILRQFIKKLNLSNIILLGHDTGGPSAFQVAIKEADIFSGLILTDTIIYPVSQYHKIQKMFGIVGSPLFSWVNSLTNFLVRTTFNFGVRTRKLAKIEKQEYYKMFSTKKRRKYITQMLYNLKQSEEFMKEIEQGFATILNTKPTLLIYGEKDPVHQLGIPDRIHQTMLNSELFLINNEGHFPHEGQPKQMSDIIHDWIERTSLSNVESKPTNDFLSSSKDLHEQP